MSEASDNVGVALALVAGAGASTGLGAAVVFIPSIVKLASRKVLAGSLGFSAGVMSYVSFIEIFGKSHSSFVEAGFEENMSNLYATLCFFGGVIVMMVLNFLVGKLLGGNSHRQSTLDGNNRRRVKTDTVSEAELNVQCCTNDPVGRLENMKKMANDLEEKEEENTKKMTNDLEEKDQEKAEKQNPMMSEGIEDDFVDNLPLEDVASDVSGDEAVGDIEGVQQNTGEPNKEEKKKLVKMGMNTALAIALHNFPEGLATFVAALQDPKVGAILAFAIAIHNIPEGLCVALPIFYATGNRRNAFLWALLSGASELFAALLGWAILAKTMNMTIYATLFGLVAGMMVIISVRELLPTAHFYDPDDTVVTYSFIGGMLLMAFSLVLFQL